MRRHTVAWGLWLAVMAGCTTYDGGMFWSHGTGQTSEPAVPALQDVSVRADLWIVRNGDGLQAHLPVRVRNDGMEPIKVDLGGARLVDDDGKAYRLSEPKGELKVAPGVEESFTWVFSLAPLAKTRDVGRIGYLHLEWAIATKGAEAPAQVRTRFERRVPVAPPPPPPPPPYG